MSRTTNNILLTISRIITPILCGIILWLGKEVYSSIKDLPIKTAERVQALELQTSQIPLKYLPLDTANTIHQSFAVQLTQNELRLKSLEKSQESLIKTNSAVQESLKRIENKIGSW